MLGRIARIAIALALLGAAALCVGYRWGPERYWLLAFIQYLPYPLHLLPALAALLLSFSLGRAWRALALVAMLLVVGGVMGLELHGVRPLPAGRTIRVMTYNIKSHLAALRADGFRQLTAEIDAAAPDIVMVQDASEPFGVAPSSHGPVDALFGSRQRYAHGQYAIASRFPLHGCGPGLTASGQLSEAFIHCIVTVDGTELDLFAVHLRTPREGLNATRREALAGVDDWEQNVADRMVQAEDLARAIRASTRPVILGGDLNAPEASLAVRALLDAGLRDAFSSAGLGFGYTYGHALRPGFSFLRIDHVLASPGIGVAACQVGGWRASEHRPVIADLRVEPTQRPSTASS